jgi:hypothetical protein
LLALIEPRAVRTGGANAQEDTVCAFGCTDADRARPLLAVVHRSWYVALSEISGGALSTLISAHPAPGLVASMVPPFT